MLVDGTLINLGPTYLSVHTAATPRRARRTASRVTATYKAMSVQEYIDKHDLSKKVEEVINACVKAKPDEPISFMVCSSIPR